MKKYAKVINEETGLCQIGTGTNSAFYESIGMTEMEVKQSDKDNSWYLAELCPMKTDSEKQQEEQDRINQLTMTALDFIGVLQSFGLSLEQINTYLESNLEVKMQLTYCQNVYCGVVKQLLPISFGDITISADMVEAAFKIKNSEIPDGQNGVSPDSEDVQIPPAEGGENTSVPVEEAVDE